VRALAPVTVVTGDVPTAINYAANGRDPEGSVSYRQVLGQLCRAASDVEAVIS
jgi:hypothetical protein